ncbi:class 1 isoprenoid biosynthesis enzyme [Patescibacteria group bacterium]|nr:class 1 isoprenoid biosynthesis enzyme [Patescibacteria group bacterium]
MEEDRLNKNISKFKKTGLEKYKSQIAKFRNAYPDIFKKETRTFKTSENIAFLVWLMSENNKKFKSAHFFLAALLLSAQDDFMDNVNIPQKEKVLYIREANRVINGFQDKKFKKNNIKNKTVAELLDLWQLLNKSIKKSCNDTMVFNYWRLLSKNLNNAMIEEIKIIDKKTSLKNYLSIASKSIGASFILVSYLASSGITYELLEKLKKSFKYLNNAVRIINDIKTHNQDFKIDAVTILEKKSNGLKILENIISYNLNKAERELLSAGTKKEKGFKKIVLTAARSMVSFYNLSFNK